MKRLPSNFGAIICGAAAVYGLYALLLNNILPFSIGSALSSIGHWSNHWHILAVALMPIYLAFMIFGTVVAGIYLGGALQRGLTSFLPKKKNVPIDCKNDAIHDVRKSPLEISSKVG